MVTLTIHKMRTVFCAISVVLLVSAPLFAANNAKIRNVILIVGDGMGPQQLGLLRSFARQANSRSLYPEQTTWLDRFMSQSHNLVVETSVYGALVADSAASGTQLATGEFARSETLGLDIHGKKTESVLQLAHKQGRSTGLVSDTRITHATPAAFAAHQKHRSLENEVALDLLENEVDVMLSGGLGNWLPYNEDYTKIAPARSTKIEAAMNLPRSSRKDKIDVLALAQKKGYQFAYSKHQLDQIKTGKVLGLFARSALQDGLAERLSLATGIDALNGKSRQPALFELAQTAIQILDKNPKGFFLMLEAGQLDWAGHNNDAGQLLAEMMRLDTLVKAVFEYVQNRNDTVVVVTADHSTGGFGFSYHNFVNGHDNASAHEQKGAAEYDFVQPAILDLLYNQKLSFASVLHAFDRLPSSQRTVYELQRLIKKNTGWNLTETEAEQVLHHPINDPFYVYDFSKRTALISRLVAGRSSIVWSTGTHTNTPVIASIFAPAGTKIPLNGMVHQTMLGKWIKSVFEPATPKKKKSK